MLLRDESKFIQQVVDVVQSILKPKLLDVDPHLVAMRSLTRDISLWVQDATTDASIMLMCGIGGIGKTTIAKQVYNENYRDFDGCSFLSDIKERSKDYKGVVDLQKQLLSDICNRKNEEIHSVDEGMYKIRDAICFKKVLLVLDDVDHVDQLKAIFKMQDGLFSASKIIMTTRNEQLKHGYRSCKVHKVRTLNHYESVELFSLHAFQQSHPIKSYTEHVDRIVSHCGGLPLALQVLGSSLYEKKLDIWGSLLKKLDVTPHSHIVEKLKISFDCLHDDDAKNVFLHIACFFVGEDKSCTIEILTACEMSAVHAIDHLVDLCLLEINYFDNKLTMHQLIKDMGRYIVHMESPDEPGERSRLWRSQDCFNVLSEQTGTRKVKALAFDMRTYQKQNRAESIICGSTSREHNSEEQCGWINSLKRHASNFLSWNLGDNNIRKANEIDLDTEAFASMPKLMFLKLSNVQLRGCCKGFPKGLRWLSWHRCHLKSIPNDLSLLSLVCLEMQYSSLKQLWKDPKRLPKLKTLDLSHSLSLATSPDFSAMPNLARLILEGCTHLVEVCESIKSAEGLVLLNVKDCKRLRKLQNISMLQSLEELDISGCSSLGGFPMGLRTLRSLKRFHANRIDKSALVCPAKGIPTFPQFIEALSLENCELSNDCFPKDLSSLSLLKELSLGGNLITSLPDCCRTLNNLVYLDVNGCPLLQSVVGLPVTLKCHLSEGKMASEIESFGGWQSGSYISYHDCPQLAQIEGCYKRVSMGDVGRGVIKQLGLMDLEPSLAESNLFNNVEIYSRCGILTTFVPSDKLPGCFNTVFKNRGDYRSIYYFSVPDNPNNIQGLTLGFVYRPHSVLCTYYEVSMIITNKTKDNELKYGCVDSSVDMRDVGGVWVWHINPGTDLLQPGDLLSFKISADFFGCKIKEFGVMVVYQEEEDECDISQLRNMITPSFPGQNCYLIDATMHLGPLG